MALHKTSGRTRLGLALAAATAGLWATLPVVLKVALEALDPITLTWFRFLVAFVLFGAWVARGRGLWRYRRIGRRGWMLLGLAAVALSGNYVTYLFGLDRTTPASAQLLIQVAPLLMAVGGIVVFGERFTRMQWIGTGVLLLGLGLFFSDQLVEFAAQTERYIGGAGFIVLAGALWAGYALAQKQLLGDLTPSHVLTFVFGFATIALLPFADLGSLRGIDALHWAAITYCALNTLAAYGCFAEALAHVEASRVSVVLALNPLLTIVVVVIAHALFPDVVDEAHVAGLGILGALVAVVGSGVTSWFAKKPA